MTIDAPLVPTTEQEEAIRRIVSEPTRAALIAAETGTGKTLVAVEVFRRLNLQRVMVSAPLHTHDGWETTINRQYAGQVSVYRLDKVTKAGKEAWAKFEWGMPGIYLIGRELWRLQNWSGASVDMLVHDECHTLANRKNTGSRLARRVAKGWLNSEWTICMSATPFGGTFAGAWSIGRILWPQFKEAGQFADRVPVRWEAEWCASVYDVHAARAKDQAVAEGRKGAEQMSVSKVIGEASPGKYVSTLPCYVYFKDDVNMPPKEIDIRVKLSRAQRKIYDDFEEKGVAWLNEHPLVDTVPIVKRIRLRQITLGECSLIDSGKVDEDGEMIQSVVFADDCKSSKLDTLESILSNEALDKKVLIATDSKKFAKVVAKRIGGFAWQGDATQAERDAAKQRFVSGDLNYIVATQASISEGTDGLQHASHIMVILSENDSTMLNTQMLGRLRRRGQTERVVVYRIMAEQTYDDPQAQTLLTKAIEMRKTLQPVA